jgi:hypothetical protein
VNDEQPPAPFEIDEATQVRAEMNRFVQTMSERFPKWRIVLWMGATGPNAPASFASTLPKKALLKVLDTVRRMVATSKPTASRPMTKG